MVSTVARTQRAFGAQPLMVGVRQGIIKKKNLVLHNEESSMKGAMALTGVQVGAPCGVQRQSPWSGSKWRSPPPSAAGDIFYTQSSFSALYLWHLSLVRRLHGAPNLQMWPQKPHQASQRRTFAPYEISVNILLLETRTENYTERSNYNCTNPLKPRGFMSKVLIFNISATVQHEMMYFLVFS